MLRCCTLWISIFGLLFLTTVVEDVSAQAVAPSQVTPPTFRPARLEPGVLIPEAPGLQPPSGADRISVTLRGVALEGAFADMAEANAQVSRTIAGKRLTIAQIYQSAQTLETAYAQAGYILVRVALPPQSLRDGGSLRLIIVDGFIEAVDVKGVPERVRGVVLARAKGLIGKRRIKLGEIERRLLIAGDAPGLRLRSTMRAAARRRNSSFSKAFITRCGSIGAGKPCRPPRHLVYNASLLSTACLASASRFMVQSPHPLGIPLMALHAFACSAPAW